MRKKGRGAWAAAVCFLTAVLICAPLLMIPSGSLMDGVEIKQILSPILEEEKGFAVWHLIPVYPTWEHFYRLLIESPAFYRLFWNTVGMTTAILPAVFSTFPVFIMYRGFTQIDGEILEAARLDGAGEWQVFLQIGLPLGKMGVQAAMVLSFLEYWNLVEQPMAFLEEQAKWPLSLYLPQISISQAGFAFAVAVVVLVPALFVFTLGQDALEEGIAYIGVKA